MLPPTVPNQAGEIMQPARWFIMRCWPEAGVAPDQQPVWRFAIEEVGPRQRPRGFGSLEAVMGYLGERLTAPRERRETEGGNP